METFEYFFPLLFWLFIERNNRKRENEKDHGYSSKRFQEFTPLFSFKKILQHPTQVPKSKS